MEYVDNLNILGVPGRQRPSIVGKGAPAAATDGAVGEFYMDTDTGKLYKCTAVVGGVCTWVKVGEGETGDFVSQDTYNQDMGDISAALDAIIAMQEELISV